MNTYKKNEVNSINYAVDYCSSAIKRNQIQSAFFLVIILAIPMFEGLYFYFDNSSQIDYKESLLGIATDTTITTKPEILTHLLETNNSNSNLVLYALLILVFGVFTSLYRFHLKEIAKYQHYLLGFMRIRIAANNSENGFNTEVRQSLTNEAFSYDTKTPLIGKDKKIENPLPGHPSADIGTLILNKLIDSMEIVTKKKN